MMDGLIDAWWIYRCFTSLWTNAFQRASPEPEVGLASTTYRIHFRTVQISGRKCHGAKGFWCQIGAMFGKIWLRMSLCLPSVAAKDVQTQLRWAQSRWQQDSLRPPMQGRRCTSTHRLEPPLVAWQMGRALTRWRSQFMTKLVLICEETWRNLWNMADRTVRILYCWAFSSQPHSFLGPGTHQRQVCCLTFCHQASSWPKRNVGMFKGFQGHIVVLSFFVHACCFHVQVTRLPEWVSCQVVSPTELQT